INFSGHRGYHVHVYQEEARQLDQLARRELVDYIMGIGIEAGFHGFAPRARGEGAALEGSGWEGRLARALYGFILEAEPETLQGLGLSSRFVKNLLERKEEVLESLIKEPSGRVLRFFGPRDRGSLDRLVEAAVRREASAIDTVVTTDIRRLIRLPMSLHGKTGLRAEEIPVDGLEGFDPLRSAVAFDEGEITVQVMNAPEFRVGEETYGPFREERAELPAAAAILLLCKGVASVVI
ncbi:MAG: DNA primase small subunit domain-containing protein, partial [Candidatus Bathyarchaeia archaeon]